MTWYREKLTRRLKVLDWRVFAAWLDTEGSIISTIQTAWPYKIVRQRVHRLVIAQKERSPLEKLKKFLEYEGVPRRLTRYARNVWQLRVWRISDIEKIITEVEPYIITRTKKMQIRRFRRFREQRYRRIHD